MMSSPDEPARAWQEFARLISPPAGSSTPPDLAAGMAEAMRRQFEVLHQALAAQVEFHQQMSERAFAPIVAMVEQFEVAAANTRAAGAALKQAGQLLEEHAAAMEKGIELVRPLRDFLRAAGGQTKSA
jgi:hypothetical protein